MTSLPYSFLFSDEITVSKISYPCTRPNFKKFAVILLFLLTAVGLCGTGIAFILLQSICVLHEKVAFLF